MVSSLIYLFRCSIRVGSSFHLSLGIFRGITFTEASSIFELVIRSTDTLNVIVGSLEARDQVLLSSIIRQTFINLITDSFELLTHWSVLAVRVLFDISQTAIHFLTHSHITLDTLNLFGYRSQVLFSSVTYSLSTVSRFLTHFRSSVGIGKYVGLLTYSSLRIVVSMFWVGQISKRFSSILSSLTLFSTARVGSVLTFLNGTCNTVTNTTSTSSQGRRPGHYTGRQSTQYTSVNVTFKVDTIIA